MKNFRFATVADIHYGLFQNISMLREDLLTDRADEIDLIFKNIIDSVVKSGIKYLFVLGDTFHRRNIRSDAVNSLVRARLQYAREQGLSVVVLIGNHDQSNISGTRHSFETMKDIVEVIDTAEVKTYGGFDFYMLPYEEYRGSAKSLELLLKQGRNTNRILLGHLGILDAQLSGFDHVSKEPITIKELHLGKFISAYFGHYHLPQKIAKNAMYVGSPCQHSLSDKLVDRGYVETEIILTDKGYRANNQLVTISSPMFKEVKVEDYKAENYKGKHYIKVVGVTRKQLEKLSLDSNVMSTTGEVLKQVVDEDKVIQSNLSQEAMVDKYVEITESNRRKHRRLKKLGKSFL